jgi:hypothetical protein
MRNNERHERSEAASTAYLGRARTVLNPLKLGLT